MIAALLLRLTIASSPGLEAALEAEQSALTAERGALEERLAALRARRSALRTESLRKVSGLAERYEALRQRARSLESALSRLEEESTAAAPVGFGALFREAHETLEADVPEDPEAEGALEALFEAATTALARAGSLHRDPETFYGPDGHPIQGEVLHAGALTAFGRAQEVQGPLVQVDGAWTLVEEANVGRIFSEFGPPVVPLAVGPAALGEVDRTTWRDQIRQAGPLAWPILLLGILALLILAERVVGLRRMSRGDAQLELRLVTAGFEQPPTASTSVARIAGVFVRHRELGRKACADLAESVVVEEVYRAERRLGLLKLIAGAAPLLGLLGTVIGMIETFDVISIYGSGDASRLSGGISKALVTTELGLMVAIPTLFIHGALASWVDRIVDRLERVARNLPALHIPGDDSS